MNHIIAVSTYTTKAVFGNPQSEMIAAAELTAIVK